MNTHNIFNLTVRLNGYKQTQKVPLRDVLHIDNMRFLEFDKIYLTQHLRSYDKIGIPIALIDAVINIMSSGMRIYDIEPLSEKTTGFNGYSIRKVDTNEETKTT